MIHQVHSGRDGPVDLFVIGGGINGCGIARDAAGRGLSVTLAEKGDLAGATSSASTKLFHGGLRYLEFFEFRLVREALREREVLLRAMPHISRPMRFVLPCHPEMRFESDTPTSRLLAAIMPWMRGRRPAWLIRLGLFLYDHMGGRQILPGTERVDLARDPAGLPLSDEFRAAYVYSDCWVDDARLVSLNARDAQERGATILTGARVERAERGDGCWHVVVRDVETGAVSHHRARMLVNAAGPWVGEVIRDVTHSESPAAIRLVRGSHIVTNRLFAHDKAYFLQGTDGRIIFAIPYEEDFTLIGTTDADHADPDTPPVCTEAEQEYLCAFAARYFKVPVRPEDILWSYSGVRPLYNDGAGSATAATRDYVLKLDVADGLPALNVFGGKITTYRKLAEAAMAKLAPYCAAAKGPWTAGAALPGGDFAVAEVDRMTADLRRDYPFLDAAWARRLFRAYGTEARVLLGQARSAAELGRDFGATLSEREVRWLMEREFARRAEDVAWRRSKLGLRMSAEQMAALDSWMQGAAGASVADRTGAAG
ncbi:glycerol-3-phosphate dehydrogenase [Pseudooceanicola lipolyticus]|uniref:Glycerol-3-phosphate dehydrogenase n=1 Tax=Pseudooceanicola lipolyticus TaxID=2029104 RepID=A0A2M8J596_9RHOB|nr:glycerol-3-phosphate dehydrogenase [Pseudooceanicola lipolyticus]PJE37954.1 glycerol-3-phosphate dehydrogenase [Pseudooceanicola lipolyticus]